MEVTERRLLATMPLSDWVVWLCVSSVVCVFSITSDSLWIDEGYSAWAATAPTLTTFVRSIVLETDSSISQTPLHNLYLWLWVRLFGSTELTLRMSNIPFVFILFFVVQKASLSLFKSRWNWLLLATAPFLWFYVNEARPYVAVMAFAALAVVSLLFYVHGPRSRSSLTSWLCLLSTFLLCATHMLGAFLVPALLGAVVVLNQTDRQKWTIFLQQWFLPIVVFMPLFVCLGGFYAWTLWAGKGGVIEPPGFQNLAFAVYEFLGFLGLGPPRNLLRESLTLSTFSKYFMTLGIGGIAWILALAAIFIGARRSGRKEYILALTAMLAFGMAVFWVVAYWFGFRFWGRHLAAFYPIFILIILNLLANPSKEHRGLNLRRVALGALMGAWLLSSVRLTFVGDYKRDDYRSAVAHATEIAGQNGAIFWAACTITGSYYGLDISGQQQETFGPAEYSAQNILGWDEIELENAYRESTGPVVVVLSKPDVFDSKQHIQRWLTKRNAKLVAAPRTFNIYTIP